jgi:hypothetical protein
MALPEKAGGFPERGGAVAQAHDRAHEIAAKGLVLRLEPVPVKPEARARVGGGAGVRAAALAAAFGEEVIEAAPVAVVGDLAHGSLHLPAAAAGPEVFALLSFGAGLAVEVHGESFLVGETGSGLEVFSSLKPGHDEVNSRRICARGIVRCPLK